MKDQLLIESLNASEANLITETFKDKKDTYLQGIFMQAEQKNRNNRVYPLGEMTTAVTAMNEYIKLNGGLFGELDHPEDRLSIAMDRISHVILEMYMDGNNVIGKAKLLDTHMGLIAKEIAKSGAKYGVSSRGTGQVNESGIVSGFKLVTIDLVVNPSAYGAVPNTIYEHVDLYKKGKILSLAEAMQHDDDAQKYFKKEITKFVSSIFH